MRHVMSLLRHVERCNHYDAKDYLPFLHDGARLGLIRRNNADALRRFPSHFAVESERVVFKTAGSFDDLSKIIDEVTEALVGDGLIAKWRYECFTVATHWGAKPHFMVDRGVVPFLGGRPAGVHPHGSVRDGKSLKLWVARRSPTKAVAPDKLDNLVAGGIGYP